MTQKKTFLVIETFRGDAAPVYRRFREQGRMMPDGLEYVASWIDRDFRRCWQIMEAPERALLDQWMARWSDLMDFEVLEVMSSKQAVEAIAPRL